MRLAVSSASTPSLTPEQLVTGLVANGYQGVEWRVANVASIDSQLPWDFRTNNRCTVAQSLQPLRNIASRCADAGLSIVALSPYLTVGEIAPAEELIEMAAEIGVPCIRVWAPSTAVRGPYRAAQDRLRRWFDALTPALRRHGVRLALEIHQATVCPSASMAMRLVEDVDRRVVGLIYDIGNLAVEGYEHSGLALELIGAHLTHVQIKNAAWTPGAAGQGWRWSWCPMEEGLLPLPAIVAQLAQHGYDGWLSAEDFSTRYPDAEKLARNHDLLTRWIANATSALALPPQSTDTP